MFVGWEHCAEIVAHLNPLRFFFQRTTYEATATLPRVQGVSPPDRAEPQTPPVAHVVRATS